MGATESKFLAPYTLHNQASIPYFFSPAAGTTPPIDSAATLPSSPGDHNAISNPSTSAFTIRKATTKANGIPVTVFSWTKKQAAVTTNERNAAGGTGGDDAAHLGKAVQRLKTIRHPGIIRFIDGVVDESCVIYVTENVVPLKQVLMEMPGEEICMGLFNLIKTIEFLHSEMLSHNNIQLDSVFVTDSANGRRWVLGGMEYLTSFNEPATSITTNVLPNLHRHFPPQDIPPEDQPLSSSSQPLIPTQSAASQTRTEGIQPDARDCYCLGRLISELIQLKLLSPDSDTGHQDGTDLVDWTGLHAIADALASANPTERKRASEVVRSEWFEGNPIINVVENFLKEIRVVPVEVKKERFRHLPTELRALPLNTTISYVLPLVLTPEFASEPGAQGLYEQLFTPLHYVDGTDHHSEEPQGLLPIETYKETVLPFIVRLWRSRSYSARMLVLDLFECYFTHLLTQQPTNLESLLIPELILGLDEADDAVYLLSLKALSLATEKLGLDSIPPHAGASSPKPVLSRTGSDSNSANTKRTPVARLPSLQDVKHHKEKAGDDKPLPRPPPHRTPSTPAFHPGAADWNIRIETASPLPDASTITPPRLSRTPTSTTLPPLPLDPSPQPPPKDTHQRGEGEGERYTPQYLVETYLIPHLLSVCVSEHLVAELAEDGMGRAWMPLDAVVGLWKRFCEVEALGKATQDIRTATASLTKSFHLVLKALPAKLKIEFYTRRLLGDVVGGTNEEGDGGDVVESKMVLWMYRAVELGVPFIKDENRDVRRTLAPTVSHLITLISTFLDRAPTIARKRDESSVVNRLRKVYKNRLERGGGVFARTGPRREGSGREAGRVHPVRRVSAAVGSPVRRTRPEWPLPVPGAVTDGVDRDREEKAEERGPESPSSAPRSANEEDGLPSPPPPPPPAKGAAAPEVPPKTEQTAPETVADGHGNNVNGGHTAPAPAHGEDGWDEDWGSDEEDGPDAVQQTGEQPVDTTSKVESFAPAPTEAPTTPSVDDSTVIAAPTPPPPQGRGMKLGKRKDDATPPSTPPATESASNAAVPATPSTSAQPHQSEPSTSSVGPTTTSAAPPPTTTTTLEEQQPEEEEDYFADMTPHLPPPTVPLLSMASTTSVGRGTGTDGPGSAGASRVAMESVDIEELEGWGDEIG